MSKKILLWEGRHIAELHNGKWHFIGNVPLIEQSCAFKYGEVVDVTEPDLIIEKELEDQIDLSPLLVVAMLMAFAMGVLTYIMEGKI